jgi:di/tricarboxylate transporter
MFCGTIATFVSHTVASIILMPIIAKIGVSLAIPQVVVVGSAFAGFLNIRYTFIVPLC